MDHQLPREVEAGPILVAHLAVASLLRCAALKGDAAQAGDIAPADDLSVAAGGSLLVRVRELGLGLGYLGLGLGVGLGLGLGSTRSSARPSWAFGAAAMPWKWLAVCGEGRAVDGCVWLEPNRMHRADAHLRTQPVWVGGAEAPLALLVFGKHSVLTRLVAQPLGLPPLLASRRFGGAPPPLQLASVP